MSYINAVYQDLKYCCNDFIKGVEFLECYHIKESVTCFKRACESVSQGDRFYSKYKSYYGFSRLLSGDNAAIEICRVAVNSCPQDGDVCMNLARAEFVLKNRKAALGVIEVGLSHSAEHGGLNALKTKMGVRKRKPLPLLSRDNPISAALGKKMRKRHW